MRLPRHSKYLADVAIILLLVFNATPALNLPFVETLERIAYDIRLRATLPDDIDDRITIADIDEKSISSIGHWPWNRDQIANLVDTLFDHYQVNTVGFDIIFSEADDSAGLQVLQALDESAVGEIEIYRQTAAGLKNRFEFDQRFARSLQGRNVVLGYVFDQADEQEINTLPQPLTEIDEGLAQRLMLFKAKGFTANLPLLQANASSAGFFDNPNLDEDGQFRRAPVVQLYGNGLYPSLALAVTRAALGNADIDIKVQDNQQGYTAIEQLQIGSLLIPVDKSGSVPIPYRGPQGSFPYFSVADIVGRQVPKEQLADRIVLVGPTAPGLLDLRSTPVGTAYPGVEVHANIISGMLDNRIPSQPAWVMALEMILLVFLGIAMIVIPRWLNPAWIIVFIVGLAGIVVAGNVWSWNQGLILPLASPLLLVLAIFIVHISLGFLIEHRAKRSITKLFGSYVPPELVDEMAQDPEDVTLEGQSREMTVLFSDVRGFTSISEDLNPKELSSLMNALLTPMTRVIHEHRGTIDKYMGDAIMAFWGAPLRNEQHARAGIQAALAIVDGLGELNQDFARRGWPQIRVGVGVNTGIMNVGNMGSEFRMAYTVLGDAVNLGSRIEGLTKQYGVSIIASESSRASAPEFAFMTLDKVRVKGRDEPVTIYEPLGLSDKLDAGKGEYLARFHEALELYWARQWDDAARLLAELARAAEDPQSQDWHQPLYAAYLSRIQSYQAAPPGPDWDGVFTHQTK